MNHNNCFSLWNKDVLKSRPCVSDDVEDAINFDALINVI